MVNAPIAPTDAVVMACLRVILRFDMVTGFILQICSQFTDLIDNEQ